MSRIGKSPVTVPQGVEVKLAGQTITADLTYYWPCRFLADQYDFSKFMNRLWEQKKLDFITLKNG